jgi:RNA polymerase-binding transcription factor DksA
VSRQTELQELKGHLVNRRKELLEVRNQLKNTWDVVREPAAEFEEAAQKSAMWQGMERLDRKGKDEIEAIDRALEKMDDGRYGCCERCRKDIEIKRLKVLPSTNLCKRCAKRQELSNQGLSFEDDLEDEDIPPPYEDMADEDLTSAIYEEIEEDRRIEVEELDISCEDGVVYLNGSIANEIEHRLLTELIEERMGLHEVVDNLKTEQKILHEDEEEDEIPEMEDVEDNEDEELRFNADG